MKHKNIFLKTISVIFITLSLTLVFPVCAFCAEPANDTYEASDEALTAEKDENLYTVIFNTFLENSSEILSLLSLIASVVLMLCYKRGLIPIIKDALTALSGKVKSIGEKSDSFEESVRNSYNELYEKLEDVKEVILEFEKIADDISSDEAERKDMFNESKNLKAVLLTEIEMLYEIFMSASLPQYLKERVGGKISSMKALLGESEASDEEKC